jgi:hypothetical protein
MTFVKPFQTSNSPQSSNEKTIVDIAAVKYAADIDQIDEKSEGSICLEDLIDASSSGDLSGDSSDKNRSHERTLDQINIRTDQRCDSDGGDDDNSLDNDSKTFQNSRKISSDTEISSRQHRRRREEKKNTWENLSSCTVHSTGDESCMFDMSSRTLLDDCDFESEPDDQAAKIPTVRFSAGNLRARRRESARGSRVQGAPTWDASQMSRITEHTQESSVYKSQSELSGRHSFASTASTGVS